MTVAQGYVESVGENYAPGALGDVILAGLRAAGKDVDALTPDDLAPVDQFHLGGKNATDALIRRAGLAPEMRVLDIGGGLGGPARTLAMEIGCHVTVLDLTEEYCRVGEMLTARTGLRDRVSFQQGNALEMSFPDGSFDAVWTQHATMNIEDKDRLFAEIHRVLRPGGRYALHEVIAGPVQPIHYPVPWAYDATISFLRPADAVRSLLKETGFTECVWVEMPPPAPGSVPTAGEAPPLGLHLVVSNFAARGRNFVRNLQEDRVRVVQGVFERP